MLVCLLLATSCGDGERLNSLRAESVADLTEVDDRLTETRRNEVDAGESLGKPVYAQITATYVVEGDPADVLLDVVQAAEADGWQLDGPAEAATGTVVLGEKELDNGRGQLGLTVTEQRDVSGVDGPALISTLELVAPD